MGALMHTEGKDKNNNLKKHKYNFLIHTSSLSEAQALGLSLNEGGQRLIEMAALSCRCYSIAKTAWTVAVFSI